MSALSDKHGSRCRTRADAARHALRVRQFAGRYKAFRVRAIAPIAFKHACRGLSDAAFGAWPRRGGNAHTYTQVIGGT